MLNPTALSPEPRALETPDPKKITLAWLLQNVPLSMWLWFFGIIGSAFSFGLASANSPLVHMILGAHETTASNGFVNKAVTEKGTYTIGSGPGAVELYVRDVSRARKLVSIDIGLVGDAKKPYDVSANEKSPIPIGSKVYSFAVHDVASAALGPDIAVVSFKEMKP